MMPDARSHRYCQNYNLNHFLSNKHKYDITRLCWSLFHVVKPSALEKQSQRKRLKNKLFNVLISTTHSLSSHIISLLVPNFELLRDWCQVIGKTGKKCFRGCARFRVITKQGNNQINNNIFLWPLRLYIIEKINKRYSRFWCNTPT